MGNLLPFVILRANTDVVQIEKGDKYKFTSTTPNSKILLKGAHVIVDREVEDRIEILGYGQLDIATEIGLYRHASRVGRYYESTFTRWSRGNERLYVGPQMLREMLTKITYKKRRI